MFVGEDARADTSSSEGRLAGLNELPPLPQAFCPSASLCYCICCCCLLQCWTFRQLAL